MYGDIHCHALCDVQRYKYLYSNVINRRMHPDTHISNGILHTMHKIPFYYIKRVEKLVVNLYNKYC